MKRILIISLLLAGGWAHATIYGSFAGGTVSQGNPTGSPFTGTITTAPTDYLISDVSVNLNISGGYSGGFNIYLVSPNGTTVTLLNTPSTATLLGAAFNITLANGANQITSGTDFSTGGSYLPQNNDSSLVAFNNQLANGAWTLYFADLASGGGNATLNSWSLDIITATPVPEPITYALAGFGLVFVVGTAGRFYLRRRRQA